MRNYIFLNRLDLKTDVAKSSLSIFHQCLNDDLNFLIQVDIIRGLKREVVPIMQKYILLLNLKLVSLLHRVIWDT